MPVNENSNDQLASLYEGDEKAFTKFYRETYSSVEAFAFNFTKNLEDAKDVVVNAYVKFWNTVKTWKGTEKEAEITTLPHLKNYLYKIVRNECIDFLRAKPQTRFNLDMLENIPTEDSTAYAEQILEIELYTIIRQCIQLLKDTKYKKVTELAYLENKPVQEIADLLELKVDTVYKHRERGWKKIVEFAKGFYYICQAILLIYLIFLFLGKWMLKLILIPH